MCIRDSQKDPRRTQRGAERRQQQDDRRKQIDVHIAFPLPTDVCGRKRECEFRKRRPPCPGSLRFFCTAFLIPTARASSPCTAVLPKHSSAAVAAVLTHEPVLAQPLGLFPAAADAVEQPSLQRAVRIADLRHSICIPERLPSFLSRHQIALFHSFRASFPAALAAQRVHFITFWPGVLFALSTKSALYFMGECALTNRDSTVFLFLPDKIPGV